MAERKKVNGKNNRKKGHDAERQYAQVFREMGFTYCRTSRQANRLLDDAGVDLCNLPFNVQVKAGRQNGLNPTKVLNYMEDRLKELFPPEAKERGLHNIIIHKKEPGRGHKRTENHDIVHMSFQAFYDLIEMIDWDKPKKEK